MPHSRDCLTAADSSPWWSAPRRRLVSLQTQRPAMRGRSGDGAPARWKSSRSATQSCSQGIDWVAEEDVEVQRACKRISDEDNRTVNSSKRRHNWSQKEDEMLIQKVKLHGSRKWSTIARSIPGRNPRQCRERWMFNLNPAVNKQPWSEQEERKLIHAHQIHGNKWAELAKLFPGRTGKGVRGHWDRLKMNKKVKSDLFKGLPEQFPHRPIDSLITDNTGPSTNKSIQDSSTNIHVSSEMPVGPKLEHALTGAGRNPSTLNRKTSDITCGKGSTPPSSVNDSQKVDGQILRKVPFAAASYPRSQEDEEKTDFVAVNPNSVNTDFSPAHNLGSSGDRSHEICNSAVSVSQDPHLGNLADLLDMSYCESLMIIPPDSPHDGDTMPGCDIGSNNNPGTAFADQEGAKSFAPWP